MEIRSYRIMDTTRLCQLHNQIFDGEVLTAVDLHHDLLSYEHLWVGEIAGEVMGYTAVSTVPGLPHVRVLRGFIAPQWQRQGFGTQLLQHLIENLRREIRDWSVTGSLQLSQCTDDIESAVYHFLCHHHFFIEHQEHHMVLQLTKYPSPHLPNLTLVTLPRSQAISQFITLYDASFGPHPWHQPYTLAEAAASLYAPQDLLFLYHLDEPIGFAWTKMLAAGEGEIEPIGIVPSWQGQGYGRFLLQTALHNLTRRAATRVRIGTWDSNKAAHHLYHSLGFKLDYTLTYLAYV